MPIIAIIAALLIGGSFIVNALPEPERPTTVSTNASSETDMYVSTTADLRMGANMSADEVFDPVSSDHSSLTGYGSAILNQ